MILPSERQRRGRVLYSWRLQMTMSCKTSLRCSFAMNLFKSGARHLVGKNPKTSKESFGFA